MMTRFYVASTAPFHTILGSNWMLKLVPLKKPKAWNLGCHHGNVFFSTQLDLERPAWPIASAVVVFFWGGGGVVRGGGRDSGSLGVRAQARLTG